jgi:hypothetical protein
MCCVVWKKHVARVCLKYFRYFHRYVASVRYRCCKSTSRCCTCCNGYTCMFQVYVLNVLCVLHICCKFLSGYCLYMHVANICFKCFQVFHIYVCKCFIWMFFCELYEYKRRHSTCTYEHTYANHTPMSTFERLCQHISKIDEVTTDASSRD